MAAAEESLTEATRLEPGVDIEGKEIEKNETTPSEHAEEQKKQVIFALCLLGANLVNAVSLNLEA